MIVIKRDGRKVLFQREKIVDAILSAFEDVDGQATEDALNIANLIADDIESTGKTLNVETIQDYVEEALMDSNRKDVAKAYVIYRNDRSRAREQNSSLMQIVAEKLNASNIENQNANVDEKSFGGRTGAASAELTKKYALDNLISDMAKNNHINNEIYIHDLDNYAVGMHNCLSIPFDDLLSKGFNTRQTDVRPPQSINTAMQLVAVIFQLQSLQQFGGVSATHIDWTMVPYVRKSFKKHFKDAFEYVQEPDADIEARLESDEEFKIADEYLKATYPKAYKYAYEMTDRETYQAAEALFHNLNTLQSRSGNQLH